MPLADLSNRRLDIAMAGRDGMELIGHLAKAKLSRQGRSHERLRRALYPDEYRHSQNTRHTDWRNFSEAVSETDRCGSASQFGSAC